MNGAAKEPLLINDLRPRAHRLTGMDLPSRVLSTLRFCRRCLSQAVVVCAVAAAFSGALPSAMGQATEATAIRRADLQVGGYFSISPAPGYGSGSFNGGGGYITLDIAHNLGVDLNFHQVNGATPGVYERTYEVGARYVRHFGILGPYVRASYGRGVYNYPNDGANLAYNLFAGGAGVDARLLKHVNFRADYDLQHWLNFPGGSINPQLINFGAAYHF